MTLSHIKVLRVSRNLPKQNKKAFWGERGGGRVPLTSYFFMDKTSGPGYDICLLCAMIADHVTLLAILLQFWAAGSSSEGLNLWQFACTHHKGLRRLNTCQFRRTVYWH